MHAKSITIHNLLLLLLLLLFFVDSIYLPLSFDAFSFIVSIFQNSFLLCSVLVLNDNEIMHANKEEERWSRKLLALDII